jgi:glycosyltransferase involved in cell wall biosynthesis
MLSLPSNYHLQLVGHGEREAELKAFCDNNDLNSRVSFMGLRMDIPDVLDESDIIVLSSHWEGLSLSSIEGMASGRPFIASDVDGLHEIVNGAGVLFPHGDDKALAEAVRSLCENPEYYHSVAMACQSRAKEYDISVMADGYADLYESLMVEV